MNKFTKRIGLAFAVLGLMIGTGQARAGILYGTDSGGGLILIDTADGSFTTIASAGTEIGLAVNALTGTAYTRDFGTLYTIDLNTGGTSVVGSSGSGITGLAFNQTYTTLYSIDQGTGDFYTVDPTTGAASLVGNSGIVFPLDLSTNSLGVLYAGNIDGDIYTIDQTTGVGTLVATNVTGPGEGLTALSFDAADNLFAITIGSDQLVKIDLATQTSITIGGSLPFGDIRGLDFNRADVAAAVPEPSTIVSAGIAGLMGLGYALRRRKAKLAV